MAFRRRASYTAWRKTSQGIRGIASMADGTKRVFYVNGPGAPDLHRNPAEAHRCPARQARRTTARTTRRRRCSPARMPIRSARRATNWRRSITPARDLLRRTQSLLIVSTNGAGYDTVNLKACTEAGVLCLNQAGGNKEAVAEHALAMMLSLSKRIVEADRAMRARDPRPQHLHRATTCSARPSASSASAMSASASRSCAAACSRCACSPTTRMSRPR